MSPPIADALIWITIVAHVVTAFIMLAFMQIVTKDAGWRCPLAALYLGQRFFYLLLICALAANAENIYVTWMLPPLHDLAVELAFACLSAFSYARHRGAPHIPNGATWRHLAGPAAREPQPKWH